MLRRRDAHGMTEREGGREGMRATQYVSRWKDGTREGWCHAAPRRFFHAEQIGLTRAGLGGEGGGGGDEQRRGSSAVSENN